MHRNVIVLTVDDTRWASAASHLTQIGLDAIRWTGYTPGPVPAKWLRPALKDSARRLAILRSYQSLLTYLKTDSADGWLIIQDDIRFLQPPEPQPGLHVYGGWRSKRHVCPYAFWLPAGKRQGLLNAWRDETRPSCESWWNTIDTVDNPGTVVSL